MMVFTMIFLGFLGLLSMTVSYFIKAQTLWQKSLTDGLAGAIIFFFGMLMFFHISIAFLVASIILCYYFGAKLLELYLMQKSTSITSKILIDNVRNYLDFIVIVICSYITTSIL